MSPNGGLYEPLIELGEQVNKNQLIGRIHSLTEIDSPAVEITSKIDGSSWRIRIERIIPAIFAINPTTIPMKISFLTI